MRLQDMDLRVGDIVAITLPSGEVAQHTIGEITADGTHYSKETGGDLGNVFSWRIVRRASTPDHIVWNGDREFDLTALETPPFLLPDEVYDALAAWPHGLIYYARGFWNERETAVLRDYGQVVRAKPAPVEVRVHCMREYEHCPGGHATREYGTCVLGPDGKPDWDTWEPQP